MSEGRKAGSAEAGRSTSTVRTEAPRTLIGGVGYRWQRDASFGLAVSDALANLEWPAGVEVADLGYGALHVADDLRRAEPSWERLILVTAVPRDREPGRVYRRDGPFERESDERLQARIREAGGGVIDIDHLLAIAGHFGALPPEVVVFELEPEDQSGGEGLSPGATALLDRTIDRVRREALTVP